MMWEVLPMQDQEQEHGKEPFLRAKLTILMMGLQITGPSSKTKSELGLGLRLGIRLG